MSDRLLGGESWNKAQYEKINLESTNEEERKLKGIEHSHRYHVTQSMRRIFPVFEVFDLKKGGVVLNGSYEWYSPNNENKKHKPEKLGYVALVHEEVAIRILMVLPQALVNDLQSVTAHVIPKDEQRRLKGQEYQCAIVKE